MKVITELHKDPIDKVIAQWLIDNEVYDTTRPKSMFLKTLRGESNKLTYLVSTSIMLEDNDIPIGMVLCQHYSLYYKNLENIALEGFVGVFIKKEYRGRWLAKDLFNKWFQFINNDTTIGENGKKNVFIVGEEAVEICSEVEGFNFIERSLLENSDSFEDRLRTGISVGRARKPEPSTKPKQSF